MHRQTPERQLAAALINIVAPSRIALHQTATDYLASSLEEISPLEHPRLYTSA